MDVQPDYSQPPQFVGYTRPSQYHGDADRLQALMEAYYGFGWSLLALVLAGLFGLLVTTFFSAYLVNLTATTLVLCVALIATPCIVAIVMLFRNTRKMVFGAGWRPGIAVVATVLAVLASLLVGIFGVLILQLIAASLIRRFGVQGGFLGFGKRRIQHAIEELRTGPALPPVQTIPSLP